VAEAVYLSSRVVVMSARPGRIVGEVAVPLPYPRVPDLRFEPAFVDAAHEVSSLLRSAHQ
jgi:NitT/TauT family transport system ATP-binding protein